MPSGRERGALGACGRTCLTQRCAGGDGRGRRSCARAPSHDKRAPWSPARGGGHGGRRREWGRVMHRTLSPHSRPHARPAGRDTHSTAPHVLPLLWLRGPRVRARRGAGMRGDGGRGAGAVCGGQPKAQPTLATAAAEAGDWLVFERGARPRPTHENQRRAAAPRRRSSRRPPLPHSPPSPPPAAPATLFRAAADRTSPSRARTCRRQGGIRRQGG